MALGCMVVQNPTGDSMPKIMTPKLVKEYQNQSATYGMFSPNGAAHIVCPNCRGLVMMFDELTTQQKHEISQEEDFEKQSNKLIELTGCDQRQAKANIIHLIGSSQKCRKCETNVPKGALLCSKCMSVNLHWHQTE